MNIIRTLADLGNDFDSRGLTAAADAVDTVAKIIVAQFESGIPYWIQNERCFKNCYRRKRGTSDTKSAQEVWTECWEEYNEAVNKKDGSFDKYASAGASPISVDAQFANDVKVKIASGTFVADAIIDTIDERLGSMSEPLHVAATAIMDVADKSTDEEFQQKCSSAAIELVKLSQMAMPADANPKPQGGMMGNAARFLGRGIRNQWNKRMNQGTYQMENWNKAQDQARRQIQQQLVQMDPRLVGQLANGRGGAAVIRQLDPVRRFLVERASKLGNQQMLTFFQNPTNFGTFVRPTAGAVWNQYKNSPEFQQQQQRRDGIRGKQQEFAHQRGMQNDSFAGQRGLAEQQGQNANMLESTRGNNAVNQSIQQGFNERGLAQTQGRADVMRSRQEGANATGLAEMQGNQRNQLEQTKNQGTVDRMNADATNQSNMSRQNHEQTMTREQAQHEMAQLQQRMQFLQQQYAQMAGGAGAAMMHGTGVDGQLDPAAAAAAAKTQRGVNRKVNPTARPPRPQQPVGAAPAGGNSTPLIRP